MSGQQHRASRCVFVGNIPYDATEEQLVQICEEVGPVVSFRLVVDRDTGKPKGYGFCEFRDEETALSARRNLQGYDINGRQLRVDFAENEKGGGGLDRNREQQGRGGPGFQQTATHLDVQKQGGGSSLLSGFGAGPTPVEQPIGRAAASAAALVMAGALGGAQQPPNILLQGQGQGPLQPMIAPQAPITGNGGQAAGTDALTSHLAGMSKYQLYEIMTQMKIMIQQNQQQARQILVANPQLTKALFQAQIILGMVRTPNVGVASQMPQAQQPTLAQPPILQQQPPPPRPPHTHAPPPAQMQPQPTNKPFQPHLPQPQQQQQQQLLQPQAPQQQQQLPPPPPQGSFQGLMQTSLGMAFQQGPPLPLPNQPPPQQLYQMGTNMMGASLSRIGTNASGGPVGQGNGGMLSGGGTMGLGGNGQIARGPNPNAGLGSIDSRVAQPNQGLSSGATAGLSGVHGQSPMPVAGPMSSGHSLVSGNGGAVSGLTSIPNSLAGLQMMGDPNGRGYAGMNTGMNAPMNASMNPGVNSSLNTGLNLNMNSGLNVGLPQGLNPGFNASTNAGMNPNMNTGLHANMNNAVLNTGMNPGLSMGINVPLVGFSGTTDGTSVTTATLQAQAYPQLLPQAAPPQQPQVQAPLELEQQKALLQQVMNLTTEQIMSLPPDQRQQVLQLQQALR